MARFGHRWEQDVEELFDNGYPPFLPLPLRLKRILIPITATNLLFPFTYPVLLSSPSGITFATDFNKMEQSYVI